MADVAARASGLRRAEIIAVGSELLVPPRLDTNSLFVTQRLNDLGIEVRVKSVVGDHRGDLEDVFRQALGRADLVVLTGGLGPTDDDLTREAVSAALGRPMAEDPAIVERIRQRFARRGVPMAEVNRRQAFVPAGAVVLPNDQGTAPGLWLVDGGRAVVLLPGPPRELRPMFDRVVDEFLAPLAGAERVFRRVIKTSGRTESEIEQRTVPIYGRWVSEPMPIATTVLAAPGQVELHLSVRAAGREQAAGRLDAAVAALAEVLGPDVFSVDGRELEEVVGDELRARRLTISVAESCSGGLLSSRLTDVPGSSEYVLANFVCYGNAAKIALLGVPAEVLAEHGAVSEPTALAMAVGTSRAAGTDLGVGVTGIAGPGGGTDAKPVGLVSVAVAHGGAHVARSFRFPFERVRNKAAAAQVALDMVRRVLSGLPPPDGFLARPPGAHS